MKPDIFLKTAQARHLYESCANLPIIDYHNHLSPIELAHDRRFDNITELWLAPDPYKHRLLRICGIEEQKITGDDTPYEKFRTFCEVFPYLAGNPVYDWARMELSQVFGIDELPSKDNARKLYDQTREMLQSPEFSYHGILRCFHVEYLAPVVSLSDELSHFDGVRVAPSLRGDSLLSPDRALLGFLQNQTGIAVTDTDSYVRAIAVILDRFDARGCRFADHALDSDFFENDAAGQKTDLLRRLGNEYEKRHWTLLLHLDAKRQTSTRLRNLAGAAGGYACAGGNFPIAKVCDLLNGMEESGGLPDTVLFPLNMNDQAPISILQGSFSEDGRANKVSLGPAWWWCDHAKGICETLSSVASFGVLSQFIGMTTDSRNVLSFVRHDYFRRILCTWLAEQNERGDWDLPFGVLQEIAVNVSYQNAKKKLKK